MLTQSSMGHEEVIYYSTE